MASLRNWIFAKVTTSAEVFQDSPKGLERWRPPDSIKVVCNAAIFRRSRFGLRQHLRMAGKMKNMETTRSAHQNFGPFLGHLLSHASPHTQSLGGPCVQVDLDSLSKPLRHVWETPRP